MGVDTTKGRYQGLRLELMLVDCLDKIGAQNMKLDQVSG